MRRAESRSSLAAEPRAGWPAGSASHHGERRCWLVAKGTATVRVGDRKAMSWRPRRRAAPPGAMAGPGGPRASRSSVRPGRTPHRASPWSTSTPGVRSRSFGSSRAKASLPTNAKASARPARGRQPRSPGRGARLDHREPRQPSISGGLQSAAFQPRPRRPRAVVHGHLERRAGDGHVFQGRGSGPSRYREWLREIILNLASPGAAIL
jgi:hypothetical protein